MAKWEDYGTSNTGAVENDPYCMPSWNARNIKMMNSEMGYHDMGDRANSKCPTNMVGEKANKQEMGRLQKEGRKND